LNFSIVRVGLIYGNAAPAIRAVEIIKRHAAPPSGWYYSKRHP
jgi:hypothetical protein